MLLSTHVTSVLFSIILPDYKLLLELLALTQATCSYALLESERWSGLIDKTMGLQTKQQLASKVLQQIALAIYIERRQTLQDCMMLSYLHWFLVIPSKNITQKNKRESGKGREEREGEGMEDKMGYTNCQSPQVQQVTFQRRSSSQCTKH